MSLIVLSLISSINYLIVCFQSLSKEILDSFGFTSDLSVPQIASITPVAFTLAISR